MIKRKQYSIGCFNDQYSTQPVIAIAVYNYILPYAEVKDISGQLIR